MRVAIPVWGERVSPVFDVANRIMLVDVEHGVEQARTEESIEEAVQSRRVRRLVDRGVQVLICGGISRALATMLLAAGVAVIAWKAGPANAVLRAYLEGRLEEPRWKMPGRRLRREADKIRGSPRRA
jgi:predicted Fe-Mo cluster-binding NifX family protein